MDGKNNEYKPPRRPSSRNRTRNSTSSNHTSNSNSNNHSNNINSSNNTRGNRPRTHSINTVSTSNSSSFDRNESRDDDYHDNPGINLGFSSIVIDTTPIRRNGSTGRSSSSNDNNHNHNHDDSSGTSNQRHRRDSNGSKNTNKSKSTNSKSRSSKDTYIATATTATAITTTGIVNRKRSSKQTPQKDKSTRSTITASTSATNTSSTIISSTSRGRDRRSSSKRGRSTSRSQSVNPRNSSTSRNRASSKCSVRGGSTNRSKSTMDGTTLLPNEIEPNVHHDAIMTWEIDGPVIAEMKENAMFARQAGINFTKEGGDYLTLVNSNSTITSIQDEEFLDNIQLSPTHSRNTTAEHSMLYDGHDNDFPPNATFLHVTQSASREMVGCDSDLAYLRDVAGALFINWKDKTSSALARRLRDFQFAQEKRRKKFGEERPWGILGLYDHLAAVRADVQWAEDAACRRANGEPYKAWFEYVDDQGKGNNRPFFTYFILLLCTAFLLASIGVNDWKIEPLNVNPMIGPSALTLVKLGAKDSHLIVQEKEVWRLISAMVLHAGFIHYLLNMLALWFIGSAVEQCHGFFAALILFVLPAVGGTLLSAIFLPEYITVGASAGIFGLIGACLADISLNWSLLFNDFVNKGTGHRHTVVLLVLFLDIVVNSLVGLTPFVDNFAHLGGMAFGYLCGTSTMRRVTTDMFGAEQKKTFRSTLKYHFGKFFGIIVTLVGMSTAFTLLMNGDGRTSPCPSCDALSCIAFPPWTSYENKWWYCDDCGSVTADARIDSNTNQFDQLTLHCPGGNDVLIDMGENFENDKYWLESMLPTFCRDRCPNVHS